MSLNDDFWGVVYRPCCIYLFSILCGLTLHYFLTESLLSNIYFAFVIAGGKNPPPPFLLMLSRLRSVPIAKKLTHPCYLHCVKSVVEIYYYDSPFGCPVPIIGLMSKERQYDLY